MYKKSNVLVISGCDSEGYKSKAYLSTEHSRDFNGDIESLAMALGFKCDMQAGVYDDRTGRAHAVGRTSFCAYPIDDVCFEAWLDYACADVCISESLREHLCDYTVLSHNVPYTIAEIRYIDNEPFFLMETSDHDIQRSFQGLNRDLTEQVYLPASLFKD